MSKAVNPNPLPPSAAGEAARTSRRESLTARMESGLAHPQPDPEQGAALRSYFAGAADTVARIRAGGCLLPELPPLPPPGPSD